MSLCDKCGLPVPAKNDATWFEAIIQDNPLGLLSVRARHLLTVTDESGTVLCIGSPSRAQYLEGQPPDPRYPYLKEREIPYRLAYAQLQEEVGESDD